MKPPKIAAGINRTKSTGAVSLNDCAIVPAWFFDDIVDTVQDVASDAWNWVKENGCTAACSAAEAGAKALCDYKGGGDACKAAATQAANFCRSRC